MRHIKLLRWQANHIHITVWIVDGECYAKLDIRWASPTREKFQYILFFAGPRQALDTDYENIL